MLLLFLTSLHIEEASEDVPQLTYLTPMTVKIGRKFFFKYINNLKVKYTENESKLTYLGYLEIWKKENPQLIDILDDTFYSNLGYKAVDILMSSNMVETTLKRSTKADFTHFYLTLEIVDKNLRSKETKNLVFNLPVRLPMLCKPNEYGLGDNKEKIMTAYLLNSDRFSTDLFIEKKAYAVYSELSSENYVSIMVNNLSRIPFKINKRLLEFIDENGENFNLLINPDTKHKFADIKKKTKYQKSVFASHNSKVILQETIRDLASYFQHFSELYFPVRLEQRGRLYCLPHYLDYQSSELAKALFLFARPGIIKKNDMTSIYYFKYYRANTFAGQISRASLKTKIEWLENNIYNMINYDNGSLLKKAKDKLAFLSFCLEFK